MKKLLPFILVIALGGCYLGKELQEVVKVRIDNQLLVSYTHTDSAEFITKYTDQQYENAFIKGLKTELQDSRVVITNDAPQYELRLNTIHLSESAKLETVKDTTSEQHNTTYQLTTIAVTATGSLIKLSNNETYKWEADKTKSEKVTSSRNIVQMATGENKERNEYREKAFSDNEANRFTEICGDRAGVINVKRIYKDLKN